MSLLPLSIGQVAAFSLSDSLHATCVPVFISLHTPQHQAVARPEVTKGVPFLCTSYVCSPHSSGQASGGPALLQALLPSLVFSPPPVLSTSETACNRSAGCRPCTEHKGPTLEPPLKVRCLAYRGSLLVACFAGASCSFCKPCLSSSKVLQSGLRLLPQAGACLWRPSKPIACLATAQQDAGKGLLFVQETWEAMEAIHAKGLARNIGVSNWSIKKTEDMLKYAKVVPAVNQVSTALAGVRGMDRACPP